MKKNLKKNLLADEATQQFVASASSTIKEDEEAEVIKNFSLRLPEKLMEEVKATSKANRQSINGFILKAIEDAIRGRG